MNQRQEVFAQQVATGVEGPDAYLVAYPTAKKNTAHANAHRLLKSADIQQRIAELRAPALQKVGVTVERVVSEYARIAFADMRRFASVKKGSVALTDSSEWTDDDAAAVSELGESVSKDGGSVRFKLHSKTAALDSLAKYLRMFGDDDPEGGDKHLHLHFENLTVEELRSLAAGI